MVIYSCLILPDRGVKNIDRRKVRVTFELLDKLSSDKERDLKTLLLVSIKEEDHGPENNVGFCKE